MRLVFVTWTFVFILHVTTKDVSVQNLTVAKGSTVYLSCKSSDKGKQRWAFKRTPQSRKEFISTLYRNTTVKRERDDPTLRFTHTAEHLIISSLQPHDSGLYLCNNRATVLLTISTGSTDSESSSPEMSRYLTAALCVLAMVCVCLLSVMLICRMMRTNTRKQSESGLELRRVADEGRCMSNPSEDQAEVHYACLGVQRWTDTNTHNSSRQHVIYSTLLTGTHTS